MHVEYLDPPEGALRYQARANTDSEGPEKDPNVSEHQPEAVASKPRCCGNP